MLIDLDAAIERRRKGRTWRLRPATGPQQGDLFGAPPPAPAPKSRKRRRHADLVVDALRTGPATAEEIEQRLAGELTSLQVLKRLVDLARQQRIEVHDEDGRTRCGRRCRRYRLATTNGTP